MLKTYRRTNLNVQTKQDIRELVEKIFKKQDKFFDFNKIKVGELSILIDDGTKHNVEVIIDSSLPEEAEVRDVSELEEYFDFKLSINPNFIKTKTGLYNTIYHEVMHLSDPSITTKPSEDYLNSQNYNYYSLMIEFRAWTNEILEALHNEVVNELGYITNKNELSDLKDTLKNIVVHITTGIPLSSKSSRLLRKMSGREETVDDLDDILQKVNSSYPNLSHLTEPIGEEEELPNYLLVLMNIKEANPKRWKIFIKMLKHTYDELIELIDNSKIK